MKKNKTQGTATTHPTKANKSEKTTTKANIAAGAKELKKNVPNDRELKYNYPTDCKTPDQKKEFRRKSRAHNRKIEKTLTQLRKSNDQKDQKELSKAEKEFNAWKKETYTHPA